MSINLGSTADRIIRNQFFEVCREIEEGEMTHEAGIEAACREFYEKYGHTTLGPAIETAIQAYISASGMVLVPREEIPLHDRPTPKDYADRVQASELDCKEARRRHGINGTGPCQRCGFGTCQVYV